jgi:hypothetical protein
MHVIVRRDRHPKHALKTSESNVAVRLRLSTNYNVRVTDSRLKLSLYLERKSVAVQGKGIMSRYLWHNAEKWPGTARISIESNCMVVPLPLLFKVLRAHGRTSPLFCLVRLYRNTALRTRRTINSLLLSQDVILGTSIASNVSTLRSSMHHSLLPIAILFPSSLTPSLGVWKPWVIACPPNRKRHSSSSYPMSTDPATIFAPLRAMDQGLQACQTCLDMLYD